MPGSNEQYGIQKYGIWNTEIITKWPQANARLKRAIWNTQIFNKLPLENAWLKRAIGKTQIFNKWPQEKERLALTSNMEYRNIQ